MCMLDCIGMRYVVCDVIIGVVDSREDDVIRVYISSVDIFSITITSFLMHPECTYSYSNSITSFIKGLCSARIVNRTVLLTFSH